MEQPCASSEAGCVAEKGPPIGEVGAEPWAEGGFRDRGLGVKMGLAR